MSSIKIPNLNLYRGKRRQLQDQYEAIQKEGAFLLAKSKNKEHVTELKAQLYLDTYKTNLKHFVSPSKYRQKAEQYLRTSKQDQTLLMRAMSFPKTRYHCPNCFYTQQHQRKCSCQFEQNNRLFHGLKEIDRKIQPMQHDYLLNQNNPKTILQRDTNKQSEANSQSVMRQEEHHLNDPLILDLSKSQQSQERDLMQYNQRQKKYLTKEDNIRNKIQFIQDIDRYRNDLETIDLNGDDSKSISVDFNGLQQAKKQYVSKSKQILHSLDKILKKYPLKISQ